MSLKENYKTGEMCKKDWNEIIIRGQRIQIKIRILKIWIMCRKSEKRKNWKTGKNGKPIFFLKQENIIDMLNTCLRINKNQKSQISEKIREK